MTIATMQSIKRFVARTGLKFSADWADENPHMDDMPAGSRHWRCTIRNGRKSMVVYFSQGPAIGHEPTVEDVLDCLASDAAGYENANGLEDWCGEYGYDTDSRKAERIYRAVARHAAALKRVLGDDAYEALLWHTERL